MFIINKKTNGYQMNLYLIFKIMKEGGFNNMSIMISSKNY